MSGSAIEPWGHSRTVWSLHSNPVDAHETEPEYSAYAAGWLSPGDPDPEGRRLQVLRQALAKNDYIGGLFWECARMSNQNIRS